MITTGVLSGKTRYHIRGRRETYQRIYEKNPLSPCNHYDFLPGNWKMNFNYFDQRLTIMPRK